MPSKDFSDLESNPASVPSFFDSHFPGVTDLIPGDELIESFNTNPHLPLILLVSSLATPLMPWCLSMARA
jgi:kynurenine 3-monooxygenase